MKRTLTFVSLLVVFVSLACGLGNLPIEIDQQAALETARALQPTLEAAAAAAQSAAQTAMPTLEAGAATAQAVLGTAIPPQLQPGTLIPDALGKLSDQQSVLALQAYARDVFGVPVSITLGRSMAINQHNLPAGVEGQTNTSLQLAGTSYFGLLDKGMLSLSLGSGTASGDVVVNIQNASLGVISLQVEQPMPANNDAALALIRATLPGLNNLPLTLVEYTADSGYRFNNGQAQDWSLQGGQVTLQGSAVNAGVRPAAFRSDRVTVWATVATGDLAAPFLP